MIGRRSLICFSVKSFSIRSAQPCCVSIRIRARSSETFADLDRFLDRYPLRYSHLAVGGSYHLFAYGVFGKKIPRILSTRYIRVSQTTCRLELLKFVLSMGEASGLSLKCLSEVVIKIKSRPKTKGQKPNFFHRIRHLNFPLMIFCLASRFA